MRRPSQGLLPALAAVALGACSPSLAQEERATFALTAPDQFLADKRVDLVAIVQVLKAANRWVILPDGDHLH